MLDQSRGFASPARAGFALIDASALNRLAVGGRTPSGPNAPFRTVGVRCRLWEWPFGPATPARRHLRTPPERTRAELADSVRDSRWCVLATAWHHHEPIWPQS